MQMKMKNVIKSKSQKVITRFDSVTIRFHAYGSSGLVVIRGHRVPQKHVKTLLVIMTPLLLEAMGKYRYILLSSVPLL
jgi:hypothetical protein